MIIRILDCDKVNQYEATVTTIVEERARIYVSRLAREVEVATEELVNLDADKVGTRIAYVIFKKDGQEYGVVGIYDKNQQ